MVMNADQLAVERAAWAVTLKATLTQNSFSFREHLNDYQTMFVVTHPDAPHWQAVVKICSAHRQRNRIEVNELALVNSCKPSSLHKLVSMLGTLQKKYLSDVAQNKDKEAAAAQWHTRQEKELAGLADLKGIDVEIIKAGVHAGCYLVKFQPGNALEHLTLAQFKAFHAFVQTLK